MQLRCDSSSGVNQLRNDATAMWSSSSAIQLQSSQLQWNSVADKYMEYAWNTHGILNPTPEYKEYRTPHQSTRNTEPQTRLQGILHPTPEYKGYCTPHQSTRNAEPHTRVQGIPNPTPEYKGYCTPHQSTRKTEPHTRVQGIPNPRVGPTCNEVNRDHIVTTLPRDDDVGVATAGSNEAVKRRLDKLCVLLNHAWEVATGRVARVMACGVECDGPNPTDSLTKMLFCSIMPAGRGALQRL
eukprot:363202-Chlamydomonas_euryale.AAC.7